MSNEETPKKQVALIAGPTASGKSDLAVDLALSLKRPCVVINADSAQVYRDLRVLSARPTESDMRGVEHRLFGDWDGGEACSAAAWATQAKNEIETAHKSGVLPILVGGTGLYIRTLLDGIAPVPEIVPAVREEVRALPVASAYAALQVEDPERAARLNRADATRVARALEIIRSTGRPMAAWQEQRIGGIADEVDLCPLILLPPRELIYQRCDQRFEAMLEQGAVEEVEALLSRGLPPALPVMRAIGVVEVSGWLRGDWSRQEAIVRGQQATRNYAKRQYTWFRRQPPAGWERNVFETCDMRQYFERLYAY